MSFDHFDFGEEHKLNNHSGEFELEVNPSFDFRTIMPKQVLVFSGLGDKYMDAIKELPSGSVINFTYSANGEESVPRLYKIKRRDYKRSKLWLQEI